MVPYYQVLKKNLTLFMKEKIIILSDNHRQLEPLEKVKAAHPDAYCFIHCGDACLPIQYLDGFAVVEGNNDEWKAFPDFRIIEVGNHKIYITHGHREGLLFGYGHLIEKAKANGCDIICFGHTHQYTDITEKGIRILNPGSIWRNRDGSDPSYMVMELSDDSIDVKRMTI